MVQVSICPNEQLTIRILTLLSISNLIEPPELGKASDDTRAIAESLDHHTLPMQSLSRMASEHIVKGQELEVDAMTMPSTSNLPDDLLHDIFYSMTLPLEHNDHPNDRMSGSLSMVPISHVCRHWRELTLTSPRLWSSLLVTAHTHPAMVDAFLERSQNAPLIVRIFGIEENESLFQIAETIAETRTSRIEEFRIGEFWPNDMARILALYEDKPAPSLRTLTVDSRYDSDILPLFRRSMPSLRNLRMKNIIMPWACFQDLVVLELSSDFETPAKEDVLWTLRHSPALEILSFTMCEESSPLIQADHTTDGVVRLPYLQSLQLGSSTSATDDVLFVLSHLEFPPTTSVRLYLCGELPEHTRLGALCPSICAVQARVTKCTLRLEHSFSTYTTILEDTDNVLRIEWEHDSNWEADAASMGNTLDSVSLPGLQSLSIFIMRSFPPKDEWVDLLKCVPTISRLEVDLRQGRTSSALAKSSVLFDALGEYGAGGEVVCPRLRHLVVASVGVVQTEPWEALGRALQSRALKGAPMLDSLEFIRDEEGQPEGLALPAECVPVDRLAELVRSIAVVQVGQDHCALQVP